MAFATSQITEFGKSPIGNGFWDFWFKFTGPASYGSGGDAMTKANAKAALEGISEVKFLVAAPAGNADYTSGAFCTFEPVNDGTDAGVFHFFNSTPAHLHSFLVKGGTAAAGTDTVNIKSLVIGKEEATDRTNLGGATNGGVQNSTAVAAATEATAATDFSTYTCWFRGVGKM